MPKKLKLSDESISALMQDAYNDCLIQKNKITSEINERKTKVNQKNGDDKTKLTEFEIYKLNNESSKLLNDLIDKKINIARLISTTIKQTEGSPNKEVNSVLSDDDKDILIQKIKDGNPTR